MILEYSANCANEPQEGNQVHKDSTIWEIKKTIK